MNREDLELQKVLIDYIMDREHQLLNHYEQTQKAIIREYFQHLAEALKTSEGEKHE